MQPPSTFKPSTSKRLIAYPSVFAKAISAVLVQEGNGELRPIYFVSRVLQNLETRYWVMEKVALVLVNVARHLRQYFQSHRITVQNDCLIAKVLHKPQLGDWMISWSVELSKYDIHYELRGTIRAQSLANFVNELKKTMGLTKPRGGGGGELV